MSSRCNIFDIHAIIANIKVSRTLWIKHLLRMTNLHTVSGLMRFEFIALKWNSIIKLKWNLKHFLNDGSSTAFASKKVRCPSRIIKIKLKMKEIVQCAAINLKIIENRLAVELSQHYHYVLFSIVLSNLTICMASIRTNLRRKIK